MLEAHLENILARYPDLIEPGLRLLGRQETLRGKRIDLLFEDAEKRRLVVEVKIGAVGRADLGQVAEYCHYLHEFIGLKPRGMVIGTRVPGEVLGTAKYLGLECKGISLRELYEAMDAIGDQEMLGFIQLPKPATRGTRVGLVLHPGVPPELASRATQIQSHSVAQARTRRAGDDNMDAKYRSAFGDIAAQTLFKRHEVWTLMESRFSDQITNNGILPTDRCYNITNAGLAASRNFRIFEYVDRSTFLYLGENYPYTGSVTWKGVQCGQWENGTLTKFDNWPELESSKR